MYRVVGSTPIQPVHLARCHCDAVELALNLPDGIVDPRRCNCSICRRKGYVAASVPLAGLRVVRGEQDLRLYRFNTLAARHFFCEHCGVHTHHQRRSTPTEYSYNVACLDGVDPFLLPRVRLIDGVHHAADQPAGGNP